MQQAVNVFVCVCVLLQYPRLFALSLNLVNLRLMFISAFIPDGILKLHQVPTAQQVAYIGNKAWPWHLFCALLYIYVALA